MNIPLSTIKPFEPHGIPLLNRGTVHNQLAFIVNMVADGMVEDIIHGFNNSDILYRAYLRAKVCGGTYVRTSMSQGSHGVDYSVICRVQGSPLTRRARAFKAN